MSGDRADVGARPSGSPPEDSFFEDAAARAPLGPLSAALALPGLSVGFTGMDRDWHEEFIERYRPFVEDPAPAGPGGPTLLLHASRGDLDYYIEPPPEGVSRLNPAFIAVEPDPRHPGHGRVRCSTYVLAAAFSTAGGEGRAVFSRGGYDPRARGVENILRIATAWLAVVRGGLLMHSACIERQGRAYLFFGQSGSGKSTLSALSRRGRVLGDDLALILPGAGGRPEAVGSPFRGTYTGGGPVPGRFPVAAAFRLVKAGPGQDPDVRPLKRSLAMGVAIANLPFVVDQLAARPDLFASVEGVFGSFPINALVFRKDDDSYWDAIESAGLL